jgi:hypothetical protein
MSEILFFRELQTAQRPMSRDSVPLPERGVSRRLFSFDSSDISAYETANSRDMFDNTGQYTSPMDASRDFTWTAPRITRTHSTPSFRGTGLERIPEASEPEYSLDESDLRARRLNRGNQDLASPPTIPVSPEAREAGPLDFPNDPETIKAMEIFRRRGLNLTLTPVGRNDRPPATLDSTGASSYTLNSSSVNSRSVDTVITGSESSQADSSYVSVTSADIDRARRILEANKLELSTMTSGSSANTSGELGAIPKLPPRHREGITVGPPGRTPAPRSLQRERPLMTDIMSPAGSEKLPIAGGQQAGRDGKEKNRDRVRFSE